MAGALPLGVKVGSVSTVDVMKDFRQIAQRRFHQYVVVLYEAVDYVKL